MGKIVRISLVILTLAVSTANAQFTSNHLPAPQIHKPSHDKLESALSDFLDIYHEQGTRQAAEFAACHDIQIRDDCVLVELWMRESHRPSELSPTLLQQYEIRVKSQSEHFIVLWVPITTLANFAKSMEIFSLVLRPVQSIPMVTSQGMEVVGAETYHSAGIFGEDVSIAVIDQDFLHLSDVQDAGELPQDCFTRDYSGGSMEHISTHGTGCAEMVYDFAPEADYYLFLTPYPADYENALEFVIDENINVTTTSLGWFVIPSMTSYFEGDDFISQKVNEAWESGVFPVFAAGNSALGHLRADFDDGGDENDWHQFADNDEKNMFSYFGEDWYFEEDDWIRVQMAWDAFPETDLDLDLYLFRWDEENERFVEAAVSDDRQDGDDPPLEIIKYRVEAEGTYGVGVHGYDLDEDVEFSLWNRPWFFEYYTSEHSVTIPAGAEGAVAIGAVDFEDWDDDDVEQKFYSSQGPTYDDRVKPDFAAPTDVQTSHSNSFGGTSAASPHAAGAAALVLSANPDFTNDEIKDFLTEFAIDAGDERQDNIFGHGLINLFGTGSTIQGYVLDAETDSELAGAIVMTSTGAVDTTNEEGFFHLNQFGGAFDLTASYPGFIDSMITDIDVERQDTLEVTIGLLHSEISISIEEIEKEMAVGQSTSFNFNIENDGNGSLHWAVESRPGSDWDFIEWQLRESIQVGEIIDNPGIRGAIFAEKKFFVSVRDDRDCIHVLNINEQLIDTLYQPAEGGFTDLAWDGDLIWGSSGRYIYGMATDGDVQDTLTSPYRSNPALSWDVARDLLWVSDGIENISAIDRHSRVITNHTWDGLPVYGLAFREDDPDSCRLYIFCDSNFDDHQLVFKMNTETGDTTFAINLGEVADGVASSAFITEQFDKYNWTFMTVAENGDDDRIDIWQLGPNIFWMSVDPAEDIINPYAVEEYTLTLDAAELQTENFYEGRLIFTHNAAGDKIALPVRMRVTLGTNPNDFITHPSSFILLPVYPNPFNSSTTITYALSVKADVDLEIYDLSGRLVTELVSGSKQAGWHSAVWDASTMPSGMYFVRLDVGVQLFTQKMMLIR